MKLSAKKCRECGQVIPEKRKCQSCDSTNVNEWERCPKHEREHKEWSRKVHGNEDVQGSWSRNARVEVNANINDVEQPIRKDGTFNPRFVAAHGTKEIEKAYKVPKKQIMDNVEKYG